MSTKIKPIAIVNASPLILLGQIGALTLLKKMYKQTLTTEIVKWEVLEKEGSKEIPILKRKFEDMITVENPKKSQIERIEKNFLIHKGEASIIALANEYNKENNELVVVIDDLAAREIARTYGLTVTGTVGIIIKAVKNKLITEKDGRSFIKELINNTSFYIDGKLLLKILDEIDK